MHKLNDPFYLFSLCLYSHCMCTKLRSIFYMLLVYCVFVCVCLRKNTIHARWFASIFHCIRIDTACQQKNAENKISKESVQACWRENKTNVQHIKNIIICKFLFSNFKFKFSQFSAEQQWTSIWLGIWNVSLNF